MSVLRQRTRNKIKTVILSLLAGIVITGLIGGYYLFTQHKTMQELKQREAEYIEKIAEQKPLKAIYVFNKTIGAGSTITEEDISEVMMFADSVPFGIINERNNITGKALKLKVDKNMPVIEAFLYSEQEIPDDLREQEFTMLDLPSLLEENEYIDIRINFSTGLDYIILSKKRVEKIQRDFEITPPKETLWIHMNEEERLRMSSALVDAYMNKGTRLYALKYVAPEVQEQAQITYPVNKNVLSQLEENPNLLYEAVRKLETERRYDLEMSLYQKEIEERKTEPVTPERVGSSPF